MADQRICCGTIAIIYTYTQTLNAKPNTNLVPRLVQHLAILGIYTKVEGKKWCRLTHQCVW